MGQPGLAWVWPELGLTIRQDSFTAWKARAGICLSSEIRAPGQRGEVLPWKNQLLPLSSRIRPYCCISSRPGRMGRPAASAEVQPAGRSWLEVRLQIAPEPAVEPEAE